MWWLRSPLESLKASWACNHKGTFQAKNTYNSNYYGVRPVLNLDSTNSERWSYAGTVCSDGTVAEPEEAGAAEETAAEETPEEEKKE